MNKIAAYTMLILAGLLGSCHDDEAFKIPTDVGFQMDINRNAGTDGRLNFTNGHITLASFIFDGRREEGGDIYFTKSYDQGLSIIFDPNKTVEALTFQVPQGNYTSIEIELETYDTEESGLVVTGWYLHSNGTRYPVRIELNLSLDFEIEAREQSGNDQVVLKQGVPTIAKICLDPIMWFEVVPASYLESSVLTVEEESEGDEEAHHFILINEETNESIYEIIITRVEQSALIIFN